ncbi:hypothetical protein HJFPF1_07292 [Paramyrothecium foliicola]|nr:hypothetical protein HJFPF1_07292 [Paramyrothecium foliicola]
MSAITKIWVSPLRRVTEVLTRLKTRNEASEYHVDQCTGDENQNRLDQVLAQLPVWRLLGLHDAADVANEFDCTTQEGRDEVHVL